MRAFVFTDASLARHAGRFVWLAIDTEKAKNAALRKRLRVAALPSYFVVDPATETVALRWVGSATVPQLHRLLDDGRAAFLGRGSGAMDLLARADSLYGAGEQEAAARAYEEALAAAPDGWPQYARAVESMLFALQMANGYERCVAAAREAQPRLGRTASAANAAASGLSCALRLPPEDARRGPAIAYFERASADLLRDRSVSMAADDRSGLYGILAEARQDAQDAEGKRAIVSEWAAFLEDQGARARTPEQRTVFDSHRLSAYLELGEPARAIPMLEASERDFPEDYNPPARLAVAYNALKRWDDALAASDRALAKAYGPRRLRILQARADTHAGLGDRAAARRTLEEALREAETLPDGQRSESTIAAIRKRIEAIGGVSEAP